MKNQARADEGRHGLAETENLGSVTKPENIAEPPATQAQHKRRNPYRDAAVETLLILRQRFPAAFARLNARVRPPLKIGIHRDLAAAVPDIDAIAIRRALHFYVSGQPYAQHCIAGAVRVDLDGASAGVVAACEARWPPKAAPTSPSAVSASSSSALAPQRLTLAALKEAASKRSAP